MFLFSDQQQGQLGGFVDLFRDRRVDPERGSRPQTGLSQTPRALREDPLSGE